MTYKAPDENLRDLIALHREAAAKGARLILNTELALSGYSFSSRSDVRPFTRTLEDRDIRAMAALAQELSVYIGMTFPQRDPATDSFYNAAAVFSPEGEMVLNYRKVYGEKRWARAGNPMQESTFETPWGRVGVAVCADSYFGLIPRTLALKGADLVWVPANWPPTGLVSPLDVWQTRAMENGVYLAACNRTGKDRVMDCTRAVSAVITPDGNPLKVHSSPDSALVLAEIPLTPEGKMDSSPRLERLKQRDVALYRQLYLEPWTEDLTRYYSLPQPGKLSLHCLARGERPLTTKDIEARIREAEDAGPALWVLPATADPDMEGLKRLARAHSCAFALSAGTGLQAGSQEELAVLVTEEGIHSFVDKGDAFPFKLLFYGPAALPWCHWKPSLIPS